MADIKIIPSRKKPEDFRGQTLIVGLFSDKKTVPGGLKEFDKRFSGSISGLIRAGDFEGETGETYMITLPPGLPIRRAILTGLGSSSDFALENYRKSVAAAFRVAGKFGGKTAVYFNTNGIDKAKTADLISAGIEGALLGLYRFERFKMGKPPGTGFAADRKKAIKSITLLMPDQKNPREFNDIIEQSRTICDAVYFGRDIINLPGNEFTTESFGREALKIARNPKVRAEIIREKRLKELGMNGLLSVGRGSNSKPLMVILEYKGGSKNRAPLVLVGKGITFDSGGISIKPAAKMEEMKQDMAGGGAVLAAFRAAVKLELPINLTAIIPAAENMPSGNSYRPGDIIKTHSGITVEVINTDAEGRIILADALSYSRKFKPAAVIDVATLTGTAKIALGTIGCAVLSPDDELVSRIHKASEKTGEKVWRMPLWQEFGKQIESDMADIKNSGGKEGGTCIAAIFLSKFTMGLRWAHIDIANVDYAYSETEITRKGATGFGIRLLIDIIRFWE
jgi:leucyl aminopeptidase